MRSVGLDLGSRKIAVCVVQDDKVVFRTTVSSVDELESLLGPEAEPARVGIEASRSAWATHATLRDWGNDVKVIDTTRVKEIGIGRHGRKNDRIDAERIAFAVAHGHVPEAHVLSVGRQRLRHQLMTRRTLVEARSQLATTMRGIATAEGVKLPPCEPEDFPTKLAKLTLPDVLRGLLAPLLAVFVATERELCELDKKVEDVCANEPTAQLLMTTPGVGPVVAAMFISVIDDASRFHNGAQVGSYLGLAPRQAASGNTGQALGAITKQGNRYLRALLVQAAWTLMRTKDDPLASWANTTAERRGKNIAVVGLARRLAVVLWALWRRNLPYNPNHLAALSASGIARDASQKTAQADGMLRLTRRTKARRAALASRTAKVAMAT